MRTLSAAEDVLLEIDVELVRAVGSLAETGALDDAIDHRLRDLDRARRLDRRGVGELLHPLHEQRIGHLPGKELLFDLVLELLLGGEPLLIVRAHLGADHVVGAHLGALGAALQLLVVERGAQGVGALHLLVGDALLHLDALRTLLELHLALHELLGERAAARLGQQLLAREPLGGERLGPLEAAATLESALAPESVAAHGARLASFRRRLASTAAAEPHREHLRPRLLAERLGARSRRRGFAIVLPVARFADPLAMLRTRPPKRAGATPHGRREPTLGPPLGRRLGGVFWLRLRAADSVHRHRLLLFAVD